MAVAEDIRAVADQALRELTAFHDFYEHSRIVWQTIGEAVSLGWQIRYTNTATGTTVAQDDLVSLGTRYTTRYLTTFTFRQFVSIFEAFFFDLLRLVLCHNPWQLARKQLEFSFVLQAQDRDEIIAAMVSKELNELKYQRPHDWFDFLNKAIKLDGPSDDEIESLAEIKASRDILEHNAGIANAIYLSKAGKKARFQVGQRVEISDTYHLESWSLLRKLVEDLSAQVAEKLS